MPLESSFGDLLARFGLVRTALVELRPEFEGDPSLEALLDRMLPIVDDAISAARYARGATVVPINLDRLTITLPRCQERFNTLMALFRGDLASPARVETLTHAGRDRLVYALGRCQKPFFDTGWALFHCGQDLAAQIRLTTNRH